MNYDNRFNINNTPGDNNLDPNNQVLTGIKGSMGTFMLQIFSKIYLIIAVPALYLAYEVFKILNDKGLIDAFVNEVKGATTVMQAVVTECLPKILEVTEMLKCFNTSFSG